MNVYLFGELSRFTLMPWSVQVNDFSLLFFCITLKKTIGQFGYQMVYFTNHIIVLKLPFINVLLEFVHCQFWLY